MLVYSNTTIHSKVCLTSHAFLNVEKLKTEEAHVTFKTKENVSNITENNIKP